MSRTILLACSLLLVSLSAPATSQPAVSATNFDGFADRGAGDAEELVPGIVFHWCPAGSFTTGQNSNQVQVSLSHGYWLAETEVTQGQWEKLVGTTPWRKRHWIKENPSYAASCISYDDAIAYVKKLTSEEQLAGRLSEGWRYALPTEAQWEYACRAGGTTVYGIGVNEKNFGEYAWFRKTPEEKGWFVKEAMKKELECARPVGLKKPNAWGLKDMYGNVEEWCGDRYGIEFVGGTDPAGPTSGNQRVGRGGNWGDTEAHCLGRTGFSPDSTSHYLGFRLAAVPIGN